MNAIQAKANSDCFEVGSPKLGAIGAITFSPDGVLFLADNSRAQIIALDLSSDEHVTPVSEIENLDQLLAAYLGCGSLDFVIRDFAIHPASSAAYLSVMRGVGDEAIPVVIRATGDGTLAELELEDIRYARTAIEDAPAADDPRQSGYTLRDDDAKGEPLFVTETFALQVERGSLRASTVTDLEFLDDGLLVAGSSNEDFSSTLRRIPFPFSSESQSTSLEIYHVSHGRWETRAPIRTLAAYGSGSGVLASYTCTPLVHFPLADLAGGTRVTGRTVAELGAGSSPIDIASFTRDDGEYVLVSNSRCGLFKIDCHDIDVQRALTEHRKPIGVPRERLRHEGVGQMAVAGDKVLMLQHERSRIDLRSYDSASL
jgi:hypothetical protein